MWIFYIIVIINRNWVNTCRFIIFSKSNDIVLLQQLYSYDTKQKWMKIIRENECKRNEKVNNDPVNLEPRQKKQTGKYK